MIAKELEYLKQFLKVRIRRIAILDFKTYYKATVIKIVCLTVAKRKTSKSIGHNR